MSTEPRTEFHKRAIAENRLTNNFPGRLTETYQKTIKRTGVVWPNNYTHYGVKLWFMIDEQDTSQTHVYSMRNDIQFELVRTLRYHGLLGDDHIEDVAHTVAQQWFADKPDIDHYPYLAREWIEYQVRVVPNEQQVTGATQSVLLSIAEDTRILILRLSETLFKFDVIRPGERPDFLSVHAHARNSVPETVHAVLELAAKVRKDLDLPLGRTAHPLFYERSTDAQAYQLAMIVSGLDWKPARAQGLTVETVITAVSGDKEIC